MCGPAAQKGQLTSGSFDTGGCVPYKWDLMTCHNFRMYGALEYQAACRCGVK